MKVSILVIFVVLPMLISIGLYCYTFISTRWISIDQNLINSNNINNKQRTYLQFNNHNNTIQLQVKNISHTFRSRYGLFGYCLQTQWLNLLTIKTQDSSTLNTTSCPSSTPFNCSGTSLCGIQCNNLVECPLHDDEKDCIHNYDEKRYYRKEYGCIWHSFFPDIKDLPNWLSSTNKSEMKILRYYIMLILLISAPLITFFSLLILLCINCIDRFYSIPFAFVSCFSFISFLSGSSGFGIFLYEWINERLDPLDYINKFDQFQPSTVALNPWIIHVEKPGLDFWLLIAAIGINLLISILSCCFCCGLQSDKSKLRIHINNDKYAIIHTSLYDE